MIPEEYKKRIYLLKKKILKNYFTKSYSQEGEDMVLNRIFTGKQKGFFVDIGAHHPFRFSNTFFFYKKGWSGINLDAMPGSMKPFYKYRQRDINLEMALSDREQELTFYIFEEPAINSFDAKISEERIANGHKLITKKLIRTHTLEQILDKYLPSGQEIDFMTIDVEGVDIQILKSNNWAKYRPEYVLVECLSFDMQQLQNEEVYVYMVSQGYHLFAKTYYTCFFKRNK